MDLLFALQYYWPRLIVSLFFCANVIYVQWGKKNIATRIFSAILSFFLSCTFISIVIEYLILYPVRFNLLPVLALDKDIENALFALFFVVVDLLSYVLPIYIYTKISGYRLLIASTIYIEYIILDRIAQTLSFSQVSYLTVFLLELIYLGVAHRKDFEYANSHNSTIRWEPVFYYNAALLVLLDICFSAVYIFPELTASSMNFQTFWLDTVVVISSMGAVGFSRLNVVVSKEHDKQLDYMRKFQDNQTDIIRDFATISEAKSGETGHHIRRVSEYTAILAKDLISNDTDLMYVKVASMMHDIGKLMIPNEIIEKPGKLTPEEFDQVKAHSTYGDSLLSHGEGEIMAIARTIAYEHHERWDGKGYPRGLKGDEISIYAQIVSVADVYDALTSKRSYKEAWSPMDAKIEITRQRGYQFSPIVVDIFNTRYKEIEKIRQLYADE